MDIQHPRGQEEGQAAGPGPGLAKDAGWLRVRWWYLRRWVRGFAADAQGRIGAVGRRFRYKRPLDQARSFVTGLLMVLGAALVLALVAPRYDRALVLSGRTEVLAMRLDDAAFGDLHFDEAVLRADLDASAQQGRLQLEVAPGTTVRFVRSGRGAARITFAADPATPAALSGVCTPGLRQVGTAALDGGSKPLCEGALVVVPLAAGGDPLVIGLSGGLMVGEEVSQGAGPRPILLDATASLLVKHGGWPFPQVCQLEMLEHLCDRFVASSVVLSPGNSVRADARAPGHGAAISAAGQRPAGLGFIRIDPNEVQSGMMFNLAAPANAFEVTRMEGETFTVRESLFDVIEKSPLVRTLNTVLVALGAFWFFLRLGRKGGEGAAVLVLALLGTVGPPAWAQQAMLRADEVGQALLRARGERCYAVTPQHVMGSETSALVTAPGRERGEGDVLRRIPAAPEPIALLTLRGLPASVCPPFEGVVALDDMLRAHAGASLRLVRADGGVDRVPLQLASIEVETFEVRAEAGELKQGMSGGTVLVADQPVGLLVDVMDGGRTGRVARLDRIFERLAPHLTSAVPLSATRASVGNVPYEIVRSNGTPVAPANKVSSLQGDGPGPWRVAAEGRIELVIRVSAPFSGVVLDVAGLLDPPAAVEVLGGRSERGPWQSLGSLALEPGDALQERRFPSVGLGFVLLRAYAPSGRATLAITKVSFLSK